MKKLGLNYYSKLFSRDGKRSALFMDSFGTWNLPEGTIDNLIISTSIINDYIKAVQDNSQHQDGTGKDNDGYFDASEGHIISFIKFIGEARKYSARINFFVVEGAS